MGVEVLGVAVTWEGVGGALLGGEGDGGEKEARMKAISLVL